MGIAQTTARWAPGERRSAPPAMARNSEQKLEFSSATIVKDRQDMPVSEGDSKAAVPEQEVLVLVFASAAAATALFGDEAQGTAHPAPAESGAALRFDGECEDSAVLLIDKARAFEPDVIVADLDKSGAREMIEALLSDPQTERIPIVGLGKFETAEQAASFAAQGIARVLPKPISTHALRKTCAELHTLREKRAVRSQALGEISLEELSMRLCSEIQRGLCDAAGSKALTLKVDFGEGSDVLAAVWGALARIRDVATIRSKGALRFMELGPEGALPYAPWFGEKSGDARVPRKPHARGAKAQDLLGLNILVVDDDPAVVWFLKDVLSAAGARVHEAMDGESALSLAYQVGPDLVISDILMPGLDGFQLCRKLKRDVALRDAPVILLSWKEDLLQRVRELGAQADGYLRKQASAGAIVERVREVMAPRRRIVERLLSGDEVKGRLDGLMPRTLLSLVCAHRPDCMFSLRDATHLYELEVREGKPVRATRTTADGGFERGARVFAALLGVGAGRFSVGSLLSGDAGSPPMRADLSGTLGEQMLAATAASRAAVRLLSGEALMRAERVVLDGEADAERRALMPESARFLLGRLKAGASPRVLVQSGQVDGLLLEDVLCDAARHGAVRSVLDAEGADLLPAAVQRETDIQRGLVSHATHARETAAVPLLGLSPLTGMPGPTEDVDVDVSELAPSEGIDQSSQKQAAPPQPAQPSILGSLSPPPAKPLNAPENADGLSSELCASTVAPRAEPVAKPQEREAQVQLPAAKSVKETTPTPSRVRKPSQFAPQAAPEGASKPVPSRKTNVSTWLIFALTGIVFAVGARVSRERELRQAAAISQAAQGRPETAAVPAPNAKNTELPVLTVSTSEPQPAQQIAPAATADAKSESKDELPEDLPLPANEKVPAGKGLLEVVAGPHDSIYVDNKLIGSGPVVKHVLVPKAGTYEIRVKLRGEERVRFATVKEGRLTRVRVAPPWSR